MNEERKSIKKEFKNLEKKLNTSYIIFKKSERDTQELDKIKDVSFNLLKDFQENKGVQLMMIKKLLIKVNDLEEGEDIESEEFEEEDIEFEEGEEEEVLILPNSLHDIVTFFEQHKRIYGKFTREYKKYDNTIKRLISTKDNKFTLEKYKDSIEKELMEVNFFYLRLKNSLQIAIDYDKSKGESIKYLFPLEKNPVGFFYFSRILELIHKLSKEYIINNKLFLNLIIQWKTLGISIDLNDFKSRKEEFEMVKLLSHYNNNQYELIKATETDYNYTKKFRDVAIISLNNDFDGKQLRRIYKVYVRFKDLYGINLKRGIINEKKKHEKDYFSESETFSKRLFKLSAFFEQSSNSLIELFGKARKEDFSTEIKGNSVAQIYFEQINFIILKLFEIMQTDYYDLYKDYKIKIIKSESFKTGFLTLKKINLDGIFVQEEGTKTLKMLIEEEQGSKEIIKRELEEDNQREKKQKEEMVDFKKNQKEEMKIFKENQENKLEFLKEKYKKENEKVKKKRKKQKEEEEEEKKKERKKEKQKEIIVISD